MFILSSSRQHVRIYNTYIYPLIPHFHILVKMGYTGVYPFFLFLYLHVLVFLLFLLQNIDCGYSLEPPRLGGSYVYSQSIYVLGKNLKNIKKCY